jgi:hypothetical protein
MRPYTIVQIAAALASSLASSTVANAAISIRSLGEIIRDERRLIDGTPSDITRLVSVLARPGLDIVSAEILQGDPVQFGLFDGGANSIGIESGVIMSTGRVGDLQGPNTKNGTTGDFGRPGYAQLNAMLVPGSQSFDAAVLRIEFVCSSGLSEDFHLDYVWASEEYNEVSDNGSVCFFLVLRRSRQV